MLHHAYDVTLPLSIGFAMLTLTLFRFMMMVFIPRRGDFVMILLGWASIAIEAI